MVCSRKEFDKDYIKSAMGEKYDKKLCLFKLEGAEESWNEWTKNMWRKHQ